MFERFTDRARKVMALANQEAQRFNHELIAPEHILLGVIREGSGTGATALKSLGVDLRALRRELEAAMPAPGPEMVIAGKLPQTPAAKKVIETAILTARELQHHYVGTEHLIIALFVVTDTVAHKVLNNQKITADQTRDAVISLLGGEEIEASSPPKPTPAAKAVKTPAIDAFCRDLTQLAREQVLEPAYCREAEIDRVVEVLCRRTMNNPLLVGEPGIGKSAVVNGLAHRIVAGSIPEILLEKRVVVIDITLMIAGTKYRGQFEERIKAVLNEIRRAKNIVLVVEDVESLVGVGGTEGSSDVASVLKPAIAAGELQVLGICGFNGYKTLATKHRAFARLFQTVRVSAMTPEQTQVVLKGVRSRFETYHRVRIDDGAIAEAVALSQQLRPDRFQPANAMELLDEAAVHVRIQAPRPPSLLGESQLEIARIESSVTEAIREADYARAAELREQRESILKKQEAKLEAWRSENAKEVPVVTSEHVRTTASRLANLARFDVGVEGEALDENVGGLPQFEKLQVESILHGWGIDILPGTGFVLLPHNEEFQGIYDAAVKPAMDACSISIKKADDIYQPGAILSQVWEAIRTSEVIVADVTGANPNVVYELGLCYGLQRCPILLLQDPKDLPFNLRNLRYIQYENNAKGIKKLRDRLTAAVTEFLAAARSSPRITRWGDIDRLEPVSAGGSNSNRSGSAVEVAERSYAVPSLAAGFPRSDIPPAVRGT